MIKAIIFDCFGVLTTDGWLPFKRKYFSHDPVLEQEATDLNRAVDGGHISFDDFVTQLAELAGVTKAEAHKVIEGNVANDELFDYIRDALKPKYKIGLLSNAGSNWLSTLFSPGQAALFDVADLSCQTGHLKPEPAAYLGLAAKLGVDPTECIFIDDQERYCTAAIQQGMQAIHFRDSDQLKRVLRGVL